MIERWGLLAGVTGVVANLRLIALFALALPGREAYDWTGPANDVIGGVVSTLAMIPVALALRELLGGGLLLNGATALAVLAMVTIAVLSLLLVAQVIPFPVQGAGAGAAGVLLFVWAGLVGRAGVSGGLPRGRPVGDGDGPRGAGGHAARRGQPVTAGRVGVQVRRGRRRASAGGTCATRRRSSPGSRCWSPARAVASGRTRCSWPRRTAPR